MKYFSTFLFLISICNHADAQLFDSLKSLGDKLQSSLSKLKDENLVTASNMRIPLQLPKCTGIEVNKWTSCVGIDKTNPDRIYEGEFLSGKYSGKGTLVVKQGYLKGDKYLCEFKDSQCNGLGTYTTADGRKYEGDFKNGKIHGQGTFTAANGNKYVGEFKDGKFNGQGIFIFADGRKYEGEFKDDKYNGQGTFTYANGDKYVGEFMDDKRHGQGAYIHLNGNKYVNEFTFTDERVQEGIWSYNVFIQSQKIKLPLVEQKNDVVINNDLSKRVSDRKILSKLPACPKVDYSKDMHTGIDGRTQEWHNCYGRYVAELSDANKGDVYEGEFWNGMPNGLGIYTTVNGGKYIGKFKDGHYCCQGTYTYADGGKYVGEWKDSNRHGKGTYTYADGEKYEGDFKDGIYNGLGRLILASGEKYVGEWKDNKRNGYGANTFANGSVQEGVWKDNKFVRVEKFNLPPVHQQTDLVIDEDLRKFDVDRQLHSYSKDTNFFVIQPQFDWVGTFKEGLARFRIGNKKNGKYGFVDKQGKFVIKAQFDAADNFEEGLAAVRIGDDKTGKYGFINKEGSFVINPQFSSAGSFREGLASVLVGNENTGKWGYIDKKGNLVIAPIYEAVFDFREGLAAVHIGSWETGKYGFIDKQGKFVIKAQYDFVMDFNEGLAPARIGSWGTGKYGFIDKQGKFVIKAQYDFVMHFNEGLAAVRIGNGKTAKYGFIDKKGNYLINPQFDEAIGFAEGFAAVRIGDDKTGKWGYVDKKGSFVINPQFKYAGGFSEGSGLVTLASSKAGKFGYIDKQGQFLIRPQFEEQLEEYLDSKVYLPLVSSSFSEELASVCIVENSIRKCGFISKEIREPSKLASHLSTLSLQVSSKNSDTDGTVIINVRTNADTSSLKVNGNEEGSKVDGNYTIIRVARVSQDTDYTIVATDVFGNTASTTITVARQAVSQSSNQSASLKPENIKRAPSRDAVAIIIGIQNYKRVPKADFANSDAKEFYEYAVRGLGIKPENIKLLVDEDAEQVELYKAFQNWLPLQVTKDKTDVYVFYSGHGLPSLDGKSLYLLPQGVDKQFIEKTAVSQQEVITALVASKPKSVTMFIDACYSGQTRSGEMMIGSVRPLAVMSEASVYPSNFTVITASSNDQYSSSSPELKHGIFSFYLMKGMEGDADANKDGKITVGEMQEYLSDKVSRQAMSMSRKQDTQLVGDANRVLMGR